MDQVNLNNGRAMPSLGFGVFQIPDPVQCERAVVDAIDASYRRIDTAASYMNEVAVGAGIRHGGVRRDQLFVTSKLWVQHAGYERTRDAIDGSLQRLQVDRYGKSVGQVVLRWLVQRNIALLAKTVRPERMQENLAVADFALDQADMAAIARLDTGTSSFFSHRDPAIVKWMSERRLEI